MFKLVGLARFELTTFRPPDGRATKLRHSPTLRLLYVRFLRWQVGKDTGLAEGLQIHVD